jgi:hypothetical protein
MQKVVIEHEYTNSGAQVRNYGPHIWDGFVTFTTAWPLSEVGVRNRAVHLVQFFATKWRDENDAEAQKDGMGFYFSPFLVDLSLVSQSGGKYRWHYRIEQHYCD